MSKGFLTLGNSSVNFEPINRLSDIFFDDVNKKVCTVRGGGAMGVTARGPSPREVISFRIADKGAIFSIKLSLDLKIVAIQRSPTAVVFINIVNGVAETVEYAQTCKGKTARIIGIEWSTSQEIIFVTDHGLELYQVMPDKRLVRALKFFKATINWFIYSPETQILITSSGISGNILQPYLVTPGNIVRLANFEAEIGNNSSSAKLALLDRDVCVTILYGLIYIAVLRHAGNATAGTSLAAGSYECGSEVLLYFLQKDAPSVPPKKHYVLQLGATGKFAIHVIDDLIVVHQQASKSSLIFDIRSNGISDGTITIHRPLTIAFPIVVPTGNISMDADTSYDPNVELYANTWVLFLPNFIIDAKAGCMWKLQLNLSAIVELLDDKVLLVEFLLRRTGSKALLLDVIRDNLLKQRVTLTEAGVIWDRLSNVFKIHAEATEKGIENSPKVVVDQSDVHNLAFIPLIDDERTDFGWLSKVMLGYLLSLQQRDIPVQPFLHELLVKNLVKSGEFQKLHQLVQYGVITSSKPLAFLLLSLETRYPAALQVAMDMLGKSDAAIEEIVEILLSKQRVLDALRFAQINGALDRISPMKFVEAAWQGPDKHVQYTVYRFFEQRNLRLKGTTQFGKGEQFDQFAAEFRRLWAVDSEEPTEIPIMMLSHNGL